MQLLFTLALSTDLEGILCLWLCGEWLGEWLGVHLVL